MRKLFFILLLIAGNGLFAQDSLFLKGTTYNKFIFQGKVLNFNELNSVVSNKPEALALYKDLVKNRKTARIVENLALISIGLGVLKLVSIPSQGLKYFLIGGAIGGVSIPIRAKSNKKVDALIKYYNHKNN